MLYHNSKPGIDSEGCDLNNMGVRGQKVSRSFFSGILTMTSDKVQSSVKKCANANETVQKDSYHKMMAMVDSRVTTWTI